MVNPLPSHLSFICLVFPVGSEVKADVCLQCGRPGFDPWVRKIPGEGNGNPLHYSCLDNPMDGGAWWATVHRAAKSRTQLGNFTVCLCGYSVAINSVLQFHYCSACVHAQSCLTLCDPKGYSPPSSSLHGIFREEYWSGLPFPSPGIFLTQGSNPGLPHWRQTL